MQFSEKYSGHINHYPIPIIAYPASKIDGDIIIEIGPGRGDFLFHLAEINPNKVIYGIEIKEKRFDKLIKRRNDRQLNNIKLIMADAGDALPELFKDCSVSAIYINFPDPWPKKRHKKNRLLNSFFLKECVRALKTNGSLSITTDVEWYANETLEFCREIDQLKVLTADITTNSNDAYPTLFAQKWQEEGRTIYYLKYLKSIPRVTSC